MVTRTARTRVKRKPLSRRRILNAALRYIDEHGVEKLSMHKLGAALDVEAMSLYNHVANKSDVLDGVVGAIWEEIETAAAPGEDWRENYRDFARAIRDVLGRHPRAVPLIPSRPVMTDASLRAVKTQVTVAVESGVDTEEAYALLRTVTSYALGHAAIYTNWELACASCAPSVADLLHPDTPAELAEVADVFCGRSDPDAEFELGLGLMLRRVAPFQAR
ncbi:MAG: TetR family transcriptional regulator [Actinophytocola sp.]|nr:TetR family transcriptional regulator [Actinophytocola sp.]